MIEIGPKRKTAFVCSGGATKAGAFHLGVALALEEHGFRFRGGLSTPDTAPLPPGPRDISVYVGSSAGSIISSFLAAGFPVRTVYDSFLGKKARPPLEGERLLPALTYQKMFKLRPAMAREQVGQLILYKRLLSAVSRGDWRSLVQMRWLKITGLFSTSGIEQYLREEVLPSNAFRDYDPELYIVASELNRPKKVVFGKWPVRSVRPHDPLCSYERRVSISEACAASTALPFVYAPFTIQHRNRSVDYIDGEIRDTLSTHVAVDAGADLVIASYTHQPYQLLDDVGSLMKFGIPAILIQSFYLMIEQKIRKDIHSLESRKSVLQIVSKFCKEQGISEKARTKLCTALEEKLHCPHDIDTIYICPDPKDSKMFFGEHFSLSGKKLQEIADCGYRSARRALKRYRFVDETHQ